MSDFFGKFSKAISNVLGKPISFSLALIAILLWLFLGVIIPSQILGNLSSIQ